MWFQCKHWKMQTTRMISNFKLSLILVNYPAALVPALSPWCMSHSTFSTFNSLDTVLAARSYTDEEKMHWKHASNHSWQTISTNSAILSDLCEASFLNDNTIILLFRNLLSANCIPNAWFLSVFSDEVLSYVNEKMILISLFVMTKHWLVNSFFKCVMFCIQTDFQIQNC